MSKEKKKKTKKEKIDKDSKIKELTETLQRLQAEFENYKKRVDKEKQEFIRYAEEKLVVKLLSILDSFELALKNTTDKEKFIKGVEMVFAQLYSVLESEGLKPIEALGKKFDPYNHEVLMKAFSDKEEDKVIEEFQRGYTFNDRVIRHSKVKISQGKKHDNKTNPVKEDIGIRKDMPKEK